MSVGERGIGPVGCLIRRQRNTFSNAASIIVYMETGSLIVPALGSMPEDTLPLALGDERAISPRPTRLTSTNCPVWPDSFYRGFLIRGLLGAFQRLAMH
ncbi:hypothetical protein AXG89_41605 (plasmid) [Burkholderia sp. PAMC 26561]|nr:hypothetical protein AXG89_41445 [Burkholderia sp. PAMC 26561]AMH42822.1 hypothetical protein AXG89_41605 [Burkholderia sp. PAMC 26561]